MEQASDSTSKSKTNTAIEIIEAIVARHEPGRIDYAIDLMTSTVKHDTMVSMLKQATTDSSSVSEDAHYALIRAVARRQDTIHLFWGLVPEWTASECRNIRESVVEALEDIGDSRSVRWALNRISNEDSSAHIRKLATEALAELEES